jgi:O-antigen/teichoic acid export membrane protein
MEDVSANKDTGSAAVRRVAKNSALRAGGYVIGATLFFAVVVLIARYLGVEGFGHYSFIMAVVGVFQLIADMGVRNVVVRDLAVNPDAVRERLGVARTLLVALSCVSMGATVVVALALHLGPEVRDSMVLAGLAVIVTFYGLGYSAVLRALERMDADILGFVLHKVVLLALVCVVARTGWGLRGVFGATLVANAGLYAYYRILVGSRYGRTRLSRDFRSAWTLLVESFPLGMAELMRRLTWQIDRILLTAMGGPGAVGLFSTAYKFVEALKPLTDNIALPLFPGLSRLARTSPREMFALHAQSLKSFYIIGIPGACILMALSNRIILIFFGRQFQAAGPALAIVAPVGLLLLPTSLYGYVFTAMRRQRVYTICVGISLFVNAALDVALIPFYSYIGAAIASLASEVALFFGGALALYRMGGGLAAFRLLWRPLVAGVGGVGIPCWLVRWMPLPYVAGGVLTGLGAYVLLLLVLQTFTREELTAAMDAMRLRTAA